MNTATLPDAHGVLTEPTTLTLRRVLPGTIERVWAYLTDSDLRRKWLASGEMAMQVGSPFALTWRNDELTDPPGQRPEGFSEEHTMQSRITELDPPRRISFTWNESGEVSFDLEPHGDDVLFTITHRRVPNHAALLSVSAGWHSHLDVLVARLAGTDPAPHWDNWSRLKQEYAQRMPG